MRVVSDFVTYRDGVHEVSQLFRLFLACRDVYMKLANCFAFHVQGYVHVAGKVLCLLFLACSGRVHEVSKLFCLFLACRGRVHEVSKLSCLFLACRDRVHGSESVGLPTRGRTM